MGALSGVFKDISVAFVDCVVSSFEHASTTVLELVDVSLAVCRPTLSLFDAVVARLVVWSSLILCQRKSPLRGRNSAKLKFHRRCFSVSMRFSSDCSSLLSCSWSMGPNKLRQSRLLIVGSLLMSIVGLNTFATLITKTNYGSVVALYPCVVKEQNKTASIDWYIRTRLSRLFVVKILGWCQEMFPVCNIATFWLAHSFTNGHRCLAMLKWAGIFYVTESIDVYC